MKFRQINPQRMATTFKIRPKWWNSSKSSHTANVYYGSSREHLLQCWWPRSKRIIRVWSSHTKCNSFYLKNFRSFRKLFVIVACSTILTLSLSLSLSLSHSLILSLDAHYPHHTNSFLLWPFSYIHLPSLISTYTHRHLVHIHYLMPLGSDTLGRYLDISFSQTQTWSLYL